MIKKIAWFSVLPLFVLSFTQVQAFPSQGTKETVLELLNGMAQKGQLLVDQVVSFDDITCNRNESSCILAVRVKITTDEFVRFHAGVCGIEKIHTAYDLIDEKTGKLPEAFVDQVKDCF